MTDLSRLEALLAAATPGPFTVRRYVHGGMRVSDSTDRILIADFFREGDREAWLAARNVMPELLAVVRAAEEEHHHVEGVDADGDDWAGCVCGDTACRELAALDALDARVKEVGL